MRFFSRTKTPTELGLELSKRLKKSIETIPNALSSINNQDVLHLKDIDTKRLIRELIILTYVGQRLALMLIYNKGGERDETRRREICTALDRYALKFLSYSQEFNDLFDKRGQQYLRLLQSHNEIRSGNWEKFHEALQFKFVQFCRGGGDDTDPVFIDGFFSMVTLQTLATQYWIEGFMPTVEYIDEQGI